MVQLGSSGSAVRSGHWEQLREVQIGSSGSTVRSEHCTQVRDVSFNLARQGGRELILNPEIFRGKSSPVSAPCRMAALIILASFLSTCVVIHTVRSLISNRIRSRGGFADLACTLRGSGLALNADPAAKITRILRGSPGAMEKCPWGPGD